MVRIRWSSSLVAIVAAVAAIACSPGHAVEGLEPETSVEVLREIQLTTQAFMPEEEGTLVDVVIEDDQLEFVYEGDLPSFAVDQVISGVMHGGYLRRITAIGDATVDADGHWRQVISTIPAELGELIGDGHFIVHFRPGSDTFTLTEDDDVAGTGAPLSDGFSLIPAHLGNGVSCGGTSSRSMTVKPTFDMNVGIDVEIDIRWSFSRWLIPRGELHYAKFELTGGINPGVVVETSADTSLNCTWNIVEYAMMRGIRVPQRKWVTTFFVGPVPVAITHTISPELSLQVSGSVQTGASTLSMDATLGFTAGADYRQGRGWAPIWRPQREGNVNLTAAEPGTLTASVTASAGIGYLGKLYDSAGPGISLGPTVSANFRVLPDRCEWEADVTAGLNLTGRAVLEVPVISYRLAEYSITQSLASGVVAEGSGRFPWPTCREDMPMDPDGPGPGVLPEPGGPGGPAPGSGGSSGGGTGGSGPGGPGDGDGDGFLDPPSPGADGDPSPDLEEAEIVRPPDRPPVDSCDELGACDDCNVRAGCGWCDSTSACMNDSEMGSCAGGSSAWVDGLAECRDCSGYGDCDSCLADSFCGWCGGGGGCMTAEVGGSAPSECGGGWEYFMCGG